MIEHVVSSVLTTVDSERFNKKKLKFNSIKIGQLHLSPGEGRVFFSITYPFQYL